MNFRNGYILGATTEVIKKWWPRLKKNKFHFTSEQTPYYNCFSWAMKVTNIWMDMYYFSNKFNIKYSELDHSANGYAEILKKYFNYEICPDGSFEKNMEKVVLYENKYGEWTHIARQLDNGNWTSKLGKLEDIEHYNINCLSDGDYGNPVIYMRKQKIDS